MIDVDNKVLITRHLLSVHYAYVQEVILPNFLLFSAFTDHNKNDSLKSLFVSTGEMNEHYNQMKITDQEEIDLEVRAFLDQQDEKNRLALRIYYMNECFEEERKFCGDDFENETDYEFGREFAKKAFYNMEEIEQTVFNELSTLYTRFATEFDFSLINSETIENIRSQAKRYH